MYVAQAKTLTYDMGH